MTVDQHSEKANSTMAKHHVPNDGPRREDQAKWSSDAYLLPGNEKRNLAQDKIAEVGHAPKADGSWREALASARGPHVTLYRSHSNSSLNSLASLRSFFSTRSTQSSASSATIDPKYQQRLENLILNDRELHDLFDIAARQITFERFENNFKRCLHLFSEHLRLEAPSSLPKRAPKLIRRVSTNVARSIRRKLEISSSTNGPLDWDRHQINDIDGGDEDEVDDLEDEEDDDKQPVPLEAAMQSTTSFQMLRENFRLFLLSDPVLRAVFDCWPVALPWPSTAVFRYSGLSSIRQFIEGRPVQERRLGQILTFTGADDGIEAISCEDYLTREWQHVGRCLADCLEKSVLAKFKSTYNPNTLSRI